MPLYDYACGSCEYTVEALQGINDDPLVDCPECQKPDLKKMPSAPAFSFKGGGWYSDLYGSAGGGDKGKAKSAKSGSGSSSAASSSSSDSKSTSSSDSSSSSSSTTKSSDKK